MGRHSLRFVALVALLVACGSGSGVDHEVAPMEPGASPATPVPATPAPTALPPAETPRPLPLDRWTSFGPEGGEVLSVAVAPGTAGVVYAGSPSGLWRSDDGAASWRWESDLLVGPAARVWVQEPESVFVFNSNRQLYRRVGGSPWVWVRPEDDFSWIAADVAASEGGGVYALNSTTSNESPFFFRSDDLGETWTGTGGRSPTSDRTNRTTAVRAHPYAPNILLVGQAEGASISRDGGVTWAPLALPRGVGMQDAATGPAEFAFDSRDADRFWLGFSRGGIFETTDGGETWAERNDGIRARSGIVEIFALASSPDDPGRLVCGTHDEVYRSEDGGGTWVASSSGLPSTTVETLAFDPDTPGRLYAGTLPSGVARSDDYGATWEGASRGLVASRVNLVVVDSSDPPILYAGTATRDGATSLNEPLDRDEAAKLFRSRDRGRTWEPLGTGTLPAGVLAALASDPVVPSNLLAVVAASSQRERAGGAVVRSEDGGVTWETTGLDSRHPYAGIAIQPGTGVAIAAIGTLHRSVDGGRSWTEIPFDLPPDFPPEGPRPCPDINAVAIDPHDGDRFYAASSGGVLVSEDAGETWHGPTPCSDAGDRFGDGPPVIRHLVLPDPTNPSRVYASIIFDLVVSEDGGGTFEVLRTDLPLLAGFFYFPVGALAHDGERLYATASTGGYVYRSTTDDSTFERWADGARTGGAFSLAVVPGDPPTLAAASVAEGVLLRDVEPLP